jgi:hypothetical protein
MRTIFFMCDAIFSIFDLLICFSLRRIMSKIYYIAFLIQFLHLRRFIFFSYLGIVSLNIFFNHQRTTTKTDYSTMYLRLTAKNATDKRTDRQPMGCIEPLLSSSEYVGECRVTLLLPLSTIELSSPSMSFEVVSAYL